MKIKVKPAKEGLKVVHPETARDISADGEYVVKDTYWMRRLAEGDVVLCEEQKHDSSHPHEIEKQQPLESAKAGKSKHEGGLK